MTVKLDVWRFEQQCVFRLSWDQGQQLTATLPYPESLTPLYEVWQRAYLNFYRHLPSDEQTTASGLRGRVEAIGSLSSIEDWRSKLVQAEASLVSEFHRWLNSAHLVEIRSQLAQITRGQSHSGISEPGHPRSVDVFLTCNMIELERLPWEAWEIGTEFATLQSLRIVRTPDTIRYEPSQSPRRGRTRILVILGDETGLNFAADQAAVRSLTRMAEIQFVGWQSAQDKTRLPDQLAAAIADERGWDVLLFAGHSNETPITGGELVIAPGLSISIREIAPQLAIARRRGLQFVLFNSCSGLSLARALIEFGFPQVAVMREPIHNQVAQEFLVAFLQHLAQHQDVHESLLAACQTLKIDRNLTYPSAYLVPSLFRHPDSPLFRIPPRGLRHCLKQWQPTRPEAIALSTVALLSLLLPVQGWLLSQRVLMQAVYRQVTGQVSTGAPPPVLLVNIDNESIKQGAISNPRPMDRTYLAKLIDRLSKLNARVVGIDFLLDRPQGKNDQVLAQSIQAAVTRPPQGTWFVYVMAQDKGGWLTGLPSIANPNWSLHGDMQVLGHSGEYVKLLSPNADSQSLPFSSLLALAYQLNQMAPPDSPQPQLGSQEDFLSQVSDHLKPPGQNRTSLLPSKAYLQPITAISYWFNQMWLHPVTDYSLPPEQVYSSIPAWQLLKTAESPQLHQLKHQVVIIAPDYSEAGVALPGQDSFRLPAAAWFWRGQEENSMASLKVIRGGEIHAFMVHHFLTHRLVVPIPDLWLIGVAVLLGKGITLAPLLHQCRPRWWILLASTTAAYGLVSFQVYISTAVLLPWLLPSVTFCLNILLALKQRKHV